MKPEIQKLVNLQGMETAPSEFSELFLIDDCEGSLKHERRAYIYNPVWSTIQLHRPN